MWLIVVLDEIVVLNIAQEIYSSYYTLASWGTRLLFSKCTNRKHVICTNFGDRDSWMCGQGVN